MSKHLKSVVRAAFRKAVFERDHYCCKVCGRSGKDRQGGDGHLRYHRETECDLDSHHIQSRAEMANGGYVEENGISLCDDCHIKAEAWFASKDDESFSPEALYALIGSNRELAAKMSERLGVL
jgi:5-methylcytosine-specific restriction endonuclease McrA